MADKINLKIEEAEALRDLEELIGKPIPRVEDINESMFGVKIDDDHITKLMLDGNILKKLGKKLRMLPESIGNFTSLSLLYLRYNYLKIIPESIGNLTSLEYLSFKSNKLVKIPESIGNLKFLKYLVLENNPLKSIPDSIGNLLLLKELYLKGTKLTMLPESIGNLSSLSFLGLGNNQLTTLPGSIGNLSSLRTLRLSENRLKVLPETIGNLKSLKVLYLGGNDITTLPESFKNLTSLKSLFLWRTKIKELPKSVIQLESLQTLRWDGPHPNGGTVPVPKIYKASGKVGSIRSSIMGELKKKVIPAHINGIYLEKPDVEELKESKIKKQKRLEELEKVKEALKKKNQVKFLVNDEELADIKKYVSISHQTQSEFIRTAIWEKIRLIDTPSMSESSKKDQDMQESKLRYEELKRIRESLERLEKQDNKSL